MLIRYRLLAALVAALPLAAAAPLRAQTCPCPQGDDAAYETALFPVTPASLPLCTADGCGTLAVQVTHRLVTPATTDGTPPPASPHYLGVEAGGNAGFPEPAGPVTLNVGSLATFKLTLTQPRFLFVPANKSLVSPPPAPAAAPSFLCSRVATSPPLKITVNELDQFGTNNPLKLDNVAYACQSADTAAPATTSWLVCFSLNKRGSALIHPTVTAYVNAEFFGAFVFSSGDVHSMDEFCLPATKV